MSQCDHATILQYCFVKALFKVADVETFFTYTYIAVIFLIQIRNLLQNIDAINIFKGLQSNILKP